MPAPTTPTAAPKSATGKPKDAPTATLAAPATPAPANPTHPTPGEIEANITASLLKVERARRDSRTAAVKVYRALGAKLADNIELTVAEAEALHESMRVLDVTAERLGADVRAVANYRLQVRLATEASEKYAALEPRTKQWGAELEALQQRKREIAAEQWAYQGAMNAAGQHEAEANRLVSAHVLLLGDEARAIRAVCDPTPTRPTIIRSSPPVNVAVPGERMPADEVPLEIPTWG